jgi:hypothetical protein
VKANWKNTPCRCSHGRTALLARFDCVYATLLTYICGRLHITLLKGAYFK